jgi:RNA recognition motif-containing protein
MEQLIQNYPDKFTGRSKGFGFVEMPNDDEAQKQLTLNGATVQGRNCSKQI